MSNIARFALSMILLTSSAWGLEPEDGERNQRRGDPAQRMERMREHLGLSDEQVEQMRTIREQGGSREEMRAVMTDEQRQKMRTMREQHRRQHGNGGPPRGHSENSEG